MSAKNSIVWFNGSLISDKISLDASDRGLTLGDGLFETIAVVNAKPVWLHEHLARMAKAAKELALGFDEVALRTAIATVLEKSFNPLEVLRLTLTRGVVPARSLAGLGPAPSLLVTLAKFEAPAADIITLATSTIRRNETAPSSRLKTLSYIDAIAAAREVTGRADDALMLNTAGKVASTTIGNLFLLKDEDLLTPALDQAILPGLVRAKLLQHAGSMGLHAREAMLKVDDLHAADAVFRTNSLRLVTQATMLDGIALRQGPVQFIRDGLVSLWEE
jgi:branched-chain amino acid aminotransferase